MLNALRRLGARPRRLARNVVDLGRHYSLCCRPYQGGRARIEGKLRDLLRHTGADRMPADIDLSRLSAWLDQLNRFALNAQPLEHRRVLIFCAMPHWIEFCFPIAVVLASRNCSVDFVWAPYAVFDWPDPRYPQAPERPRWAARFPGVQVHPRLALYDMRRLPRAEPDAELREIVATYSTRDTRYAKYREVLDFAGDADVRRLHELRTERNLACATALDPLMRRRGYDAVLTPNGCIYEFSVAYAVARRNGIRCVTFDFADRKREIVASQEAPAIEMDTSRLWRADEPHVLTPPRAKHVGSMLAQREKRDWQGDDYTWDAQPVDVQEAEQLRHTLGLALDRPVALMGTNIAWDAAVLSRTRAFESMMEWIVQTVRWFTARPELQLILRVHPAEMLVPTNEPVVETLAQHFTSLPANIKVIKPADAINTYGLMRLADFGLVYTSTIGLEMAARGIPVVVAGRVHYAGKGFTADPNNPSEFFHELECRLMDMRKLTPRQVELARCYTEVYFDKWPRPFPWWDIYHRDRFLDEIPLEKVLAGECEPKYLRTFDFLAGRDVD